MSSSKDYYDVLGIRPNASLTEIELAFKGRRTQYHPDRYNASDAETLAWATAKMKEVNEAYSILSDSTKRSAYDQQRHSQNTSHEANQRSSGREKSRPRSELSPEPSIQGYISGLALSAEDASRFHTPPRLDQKKVMTALSCRGFTASEPPKTVHLHVDDTVFRGGSDGVIITDQCISFKAIFLDSNDFYYRRFCLPEFIAEGKRLFQANGNECMTFSLISAEAIRLLAWGLNQFLKDFQDWRLAMAHAGDPESQNFMSLATGYDTPEALKWLRMAAEGGYVTAQHNLGMYYMHKDARTAFRWFCLAAEQGNKTSQKMLRADRFKEFQ